MNNYLNAGLAASLVARVTTSILCMLFAVTLHAAEAIPKLEGYWTQQFNPGNAADALRAKLPPEAVFINDAGAGELGLGEFSGLVLSEKAKQEVANYDYKQELTSEFACTQPSVVLYMQAPFPMEILQDQKLIVLRMEYFDMVRVIFLDGRSHPPADATHTKNGHSIGHWEGDELVVDTTHIAAGTFMNNGFLHSDDLHLIERFRLSDDGNTLVSTQLSVDPATFSGKAARMIVWRKGNDYLYPYECDPSFGEL